MRLDAARRSPLIASLTMTGHAAVLLTCPGVCRRDHPRDRNGLDEISRLWQDSLSGVTG